jgi:hypothetical protein
MKADTLYDLALANMEKSVHHLSALVPPPRQLPFRGSFVYRYAEQTAQQAIVQKLARITSGLHAARLLMEAGFVQEQASLQRMLDELQEDVLFLAYSIILGRATRDHEDYLAAFFQEEFDPDDSRVSSSARPMVSRKKIRAYLDKVFSGPKGSSQHLDTARTISKAYSGYLHAASPQVMDMYGGDPPRFHVRGMRGTTRHREHRADLWNYFHRAIIAFAIAAKALGDHDLLLSIKKFSDQFVASTGRDHQSSEWQGA